MLGAFDLQTTQDWLQKLERELQRFRALPNDRDAAINFFITAESMLDWKHPGDPNASKRKAVRDSVPLLKIIWDLASVAKHREVRSNHESVNDSGVVGEFFGGGFFGGSFFGELSVKLNGPAATDLGASSITAIELAERTVVYWRANAWCPSTHASSNS
jgi:hypothetical protein